MDSQVQQIKDKLNIVDVVGQYVTLRRAGRTFTARCPFHKERTASFHVSPDRGTYKCFGCGEGGDIFTFVEKMDGIDFPTALKQLADRAGVKLERTFAANPEHKKHDERLHEVLEAATLFFESTLQKRDDVRKYLHSRAVTDETVKHWRLGYAPASWDDLAKHLSALGFTKDEMFDAGLVARSDRKPGEVYDRFRGRVMFPIFDGGGRPIAFSGRFFEKVEGSREEGDPAKYVNSPETSLFKKSKVLYGFDKAKPFIRKADCILLVEGQFDLILCHQSGLPFAVALSGTALTPDHLSLLGRLSKRLVLALDADQAGLRSGIKSTAMALSTGFDVKVPTFPEGKDPADVARENPELLKAAIRTSTTAIEFFLDALRPTARDERAYKKSVEEQVLPIVAAIPSKIDQAHFVRIVAQKLSVPESAVLAEVVKKPQLQTEVMEEQEKAVIPGPQWSQLERLSGMLLFHFEKDSAMQERITSLLGGERQALLIEKLLPHAELLRFSFEAEVGEHATDYMVAEDMLKQLELQLLDEQLAVAKGDPAKVVALARRREELRK